MDDRKRVEQLWQRHLDGHTDEAIYLMCGVALKALDEVERLEAEVNNRADYPEVLEWGKLMETERDRLKEQLHLANIDAANTEASANDMVTELKAIVETHRSLSVGSGVDATTVCEYILADLSWKDTDSSERWRK